MITRDEMLFLAREIDTKLRSIRDEKDGEAYHTINSFLGIILNQTRNIDSDYADRHPDFMNSCMTNLNETLNLAKIYLTQVENRV